nr:ribonuclease H-like domain-containing protein [Tanacetum cinerariifolium]
MNEFCIKKWIKREFSNARTPQQNWVAERRNRTLIEAARTMLADVKLLVTFGLKQLTLLTTWGSLMLKGMKVILLGTSSTNISGTKDAASQAVKKDVSFLRYIALPNWFHDVHIETRNSDAPDGCNADDPKSSGISNPPTTTSKVPSAKQVEPSVSLTVETKITTVSSPVPTVCLDISPKSSSDSRLISKGDFSQKETHSLDNALTLSNRFEDTMGMEADLSNMETSILASPTHTFRIHKDHQKSQINGLVDTPVQTRHNSKEMEEQSFIATIHHKTNPDLLQFCLFTCFLSQEEPKKIFDALKDPS